MSVIKSMYDNIKSCVLIDGKLSSFFNNDTGVLQGEVISPILFSIYVNDYENEFLNCGIEPLELQNLSLFLLMYADDMILFSESVGDLQQMLDKLLLYTNKWSLSVNTDKTFFF